MLNNNLKPHSRFLRNRLSITDGAALNYNDILLLQELHTKYHYPVPQPTVHALKNRLMIHKFTQSDLTDEINYYASQLNQRITCFRHNNPYFEINLLTFARDNEEISGELGVFVEMLTDEPYRYMGFEAYSTKHIHWMLQATGWTPRMIRDDIYGQEIERALLWEPPSCL